MSAIVLEVGCLECRNPTRVVGGVFDTAMEAKESIPSENRGDWVDSSLDEWSGEYVYVVVDLDGPLVVATAEWL